MVNDVEADAWIETSDDSHVVIDSYSIPALRATILREITYTWTFSKILR